jgi:hypothetical protein
MEISLFLQRFNLKRKGGTTRPIRNEKLYLIKWSFMDSIWKNYGQLFNSLQEKKRFFSDVSVIIWRIILKSRKLRGKSCFD